jgi:hypothetical protein
MASGVIAAVPWEVRSAPTGRALKIRTRRMRRMAGVQRVVAPWLNAGFDALVARVGERAVLARFFRGMYEVEATPTTLDRLAELVAQRGWPAALHRMTLLGGTRTGRPVRKLSERHRVVALTRLAQIERLYRSVANRNPHAGEVAGALEHITDYSRPIIEQRTPGAALRLGWTTAAAQEATFVLPEIVVTESGEATADFGPAGGSGVGYSQFGNSIYQAVLRQRVIDALVAQQQQQQADAEAARIVAQAEAEYQARLTTFLQSPEMALFGGEDAREVVDQLARQQLQEAQILAVLTTIAAAARLGEILADGRIIPTAAALFKEAAIAWRAGQLAIAVEAIGGAVVVTWTGVWIVAALAALTIIVTMYMTDAQVTATSIDIVPKAPPDAVMDVDLSIIPNSDMPESLVEPEVPDIEVGAQGNVGEIAGPEPGPTPTPTLEEQFQSGYDPTVDPNASYETWLAWYSWSYGGFNAGSMSGG